MPACVAHCGGFALTRRNRDSLKSAHQHNLTGGVLRSRSSSQVSHKPSPASPSSHTHAPHPATGRRQSIEIGGFRSSSACSFVPRASPCSARIDTGHRSLFRIAVSLSLLLLLLLEHLTAGRAARKIDQAPADPAGNMRRSAGSIGSVDGGAPPLTYPFGAAEPAAEVIEMGEGGVLLPPVSSKPHDGKGRTASYGGGSAGLLLQAYAQTVQIGPTAGGVAAVGLILFAIMPSSLRCAMLVLTVCAMGALFAFWLSRYVYWAGT
jgi:hypothetical protein